MRCQWFWGNFGQPVYSSSGCVPVLQQNLRGMSCSGTCWPLGTWPLLVLGFSVGMEAFDELLSINVPWSQEFSGVLRVWT